MKEYCNIRRFIRIMAAMTESGETLSAEEVDEHISYLLTEHHGFIVTAVNDLMGTLSVEELKTLAVCERNGVIDVCKAHMWTSSSFTVLEKVIETLFQSICLEP